MTFPARHGAILLFASSMLHAWASDWPQWRGPARTGHVPEDEAVPDKLTAEPNVLWRIKAGEGLASPVLAGGRVYYFDNPNGKETLHAIDAATAGEIGRKEIDEPFRDMQGPSGPRCTPVVDGDRVYALSCRGELQCLNTTDGRRVWRTNFTGDFGAVFIGEKGSAAGATRHGNNGSPLVDGDFLYACVGGTNGAGVVCFEKHTGRVVWKSQNDQAGYAAPVIATVAGKRQLVCFTVEGLIGLDPKDGRLFWRVPIKTALGRHVTTPVVYNNIIVAGSHQAGLVGIRVSIDATGFKAEQAWLSKESAMNFASPVAVGKYLYGLGPEKNVICVDIETGRQLWSQAGIIATSADKAHAAFLVMRNRILILTDGGQLVLMAAGPREFRELGRAQVCAMNWCNPAYADGRLYVRDGIRGDGELACVALLP